MNRVAMKICVSMTALVAAVGIAEGLIRVSGALQSVRQAAVGETGETADDQPETRRLGRLVHPYRGWMDRPGARSSFITGKKPFFPNGDFSQWAVENSVANELGYHSHVEDYREVTEEQFVIGVFGGSVANQFAVMGGDAIIAGLAGNLPGPGQEVVVLNCATGAYKQPQQLFALQELLLLGVPFDVVVNLDGVNEAVFGSRDARRGYHPLFPSRGQYLPVMDLNSADPPVESIVLTGEIYRHQRAIEGINRSVAESRWLRNSELLKVFYGTAVQRHQRQIVEAETELQNLATDSRTVGVGSMLSDPCPGGRDDCADLVASLWAQSSRLMEATAAQFGVRYLHILQPNQYVEEQKPFSADELEIGYYETSRYAKEVRRVYPLFRRRGIDLTDEGIGFHDLSMLFVDRSETVFVDECCHYNHFGYQILGGAIAEMIIEARSADVSGGAGESGKGG